MIDFTNAPGQSATALILAAVLIWAAAAKLRSPANTAADFTSLGLRWAPTLARLVPAAELLVVVLLVLARPWGGMAATALLTGFTTIIVRALRNPEQFGAASCACFGGSSHGVLTWRSVMRNIALLVLAIVSALA